jgi:hypothetical protein
MRRASCGWATAVALLLYSPAVPADDAVERALKIIVTLCVDGGSVKVSRSTSTPSGGEYRLESDKGNFTIESQDAQVLVDGISSKLTALAAQQAESARACMSPYISQVLAILTGSTSEEIKKQPEPNQKLAGTPVVYYLKAADQSRVTDALKSHGIPFTQLSSVLPDTFRTNGIRCGDGTPAEAIRELASVMTSSGIPVHVIYRVDSDAQNILYLITRATWNDKELVSRPLSRSQIDAITGCPAKEVLISNFAHFENPRPTALAAETRYIDIWADQNQNQGVNSAGRLFCRMRGYTDVVSRQYRLLESDDLVSVRLGDMSACTKNCYVFSHIYCD